MHSQLKCSKEKLNKFQIHQQFPWVTSSLSAVTHFNPWGKCEIKSSVNMNAT